MHGIVDFDLDGYTQRDETTTWDHQEGTVLTLDFFDIPPDLPARLSEPSRLFDATARMIATSGGGLVDAEIQTLDGMPAFWQLAKLPYPQGHGLIFLGAWTIPRADCSIVLKVGAVERGVTGMREAVLLGKLGFEGWSKPSPYAPGLAGGLPYIRADEPQYDAEFPVHPLSLVRGRARQLAPTVRVHPEIKKLPAFG